MTPYVFCVMGILLGFARTNVLGVAVVSGATAFLGILEIVCAPSVAMAVDIPVLVTILNISYFFGLKLREALPLKNPR